jgi:hypothetical protein
MAETNAPKTCPACGLVNPHSAQRCDCGYHFASAVDERFVQSCLAKLMLLESRIGAAVGYKTLEVDSFPDKCNLEKAAEIIARFLGLAYLSFNIKVTKQKKDVAGHIELHRYKPQKSDAFGGRAHEDSLVFIEVSEDIASHPQARLATLAHEITHAYLHTYNVSCEDELENEKLTDIAAVFLGLGKLMLNGAETQWNSYDTDPSSNQLQKTTHTLKCGYISRVEFVFVYWLICVLRGIPDSDYMKNLHSDIAAEVRGSYSHWAKRLIEVDAFAKADLRARLNDDPRMDALSTGLAELERHLTFLKEKIHSAERILDESHRWIKQSLDGLSRTDNIEDQYDPIMKSLNNAVLSLQYHTSIAESEKRRGAVDRTVEALKQMAVILAAKGCFQNDSRSEAALTRRCPICKTLLRLREDAPSSRIRCANPDCRYVFVANSTPTRPDAAGSSADQSGRLRKAINKWFVRF